MNIEELTTIGKEWANARTVERKHANVAYATIRKAANAGIPETRIAAAMRIDRMTVRRALGKL